MPYSSLKPQLLPVASDIGGTFNIVFYDVFGEKYVTKPIDARPMEDDGATAPTYGNGITSIQRLRV